MPAGGQNNRWHRSRIWRASARLHPAASPAPVFSRWQVFQSFSEAEMTANTADETAGLTPGNEDNKVGCYFGPEKPCLLLLADG